MSALLCRLVLAEEALHFAKQCPYLRQFDLTSPWIEENVGVAHDEALINGCTGTALCSNGLEDTDECHIIAQAKGIEPNWELLLQVEVLAQAWFMVDRETVKSLVFAGLQDLNSWGLYNYSRRKSFNVKAFSGLLVQGSFLA